MQQLSGLTAFRPLDRVDRGFGAVSTGPGDMLPVVYDHPQET